MAALTGFGPDRLPYAEALDREWAKQPEIPGRISAKGVATRTPRGYSQVPTKQTPAERPARPTKENTMAPRGRTAAAAPVEPTDERDFTIYATKDLTAVQLDFATWLRDNVGDIDKMDADRVAALGPLCYHAFQASDFNREQKEARAAEREAEQKAKNEAKAAAKAEAAPAKAAATPKPTAPKTARGKAATTSAVSTSKPATRRGRQPAAAAAPF